jgi:ubiquinone/menaquinone biosynthesis C-methylase UbiE
VKLGDDSQWFLDDPLQDKDHCDLPMKVATPFTIGFYFSMLTSSCNSVLDLGSGTSNRYIKQLKKAKYTVGLDLYAPYLRKSNKSSEHDDLIRADVRKLCFREGSYDCVIASELIEHLSKAEGYELLRSIERISKDIVIVTTPNGFAPQDHDENALQHHKSGWTLREFERLGYRVYGLRGLRILTRNETVTRSRVLSAGIKLVSMITQPIASLYPETAYQLLCVKYLQEKGKRETQ